MGKLKIDFGSAESGVKDLFSSLTMQLRIASSRPRFAAEYLQKRVLLHEKCGKWKK